MHCLFPEGTVELVDVSEEIKNLKYTPGLSYWKVLYNRASTTLDIPCFMILKFCIKLWGYNIAIAELKVIISCSWQLSGEKKRNIKICVGASISAIPGINQFLTSIKISLTESSLVEYIGSC